MAKEVKQIHRDETLQFLLNIHYAKRIPTISFSFGLFIEKDLKGVITFGNPTGANVCNCICGEKYRNEVLELNRLVLLENKKNYASYFVANAMKLLPIPNLIISYADINFNHHGYIYQASNFIYTGLAKGREKFTKKDGTDIPERTLTSLYKNANLSRSEYMKKYKIKLTKQLPKHRYIFINANKKDKKQRLKDLKLSIKKYPKGDNKNYIWNFKPKTQGLLF